MDSDRITYTPLNTQAARKASVDVVIINTRGSDDNERGRAWLKEAIASVQASQYPDLGLHVVENLDRSIKIGKAWNDAARKSTAKYLLPLGDDDKIAMDLIGSLAGYFEHHRDTEAGAHLVCVTSGCTALSIDGAVLCMMPQHHTGMYLREWLLENPFNELRERYVDTEMHDRLDQMQNVQKRTMANALAHHFGYGYRQHPFMVSGEKVRLQAPAAPSLNISR